MAYPKILRWRWIFILGMLSFNSKRPRPMSTPNVAWVIEFKRWIVESN